MASTLQFCRLGRWSLLRCWPACWGRTTCCGLLRCWPAWLPSQQAEATAGRSQGPPRWAAGGRLRGQLNTSGSGPKPPRAEDERDAAPWAEISRSPVFWAEGFIVNHLLLDQMCIASIKILGSAIRKIKVARRSASESLSVHCRWES